MKARKMQEVETAESGVTVITPSVIACGDATFPKGTAFSGSDKVSGSAQRLPLGGAGALAPEGVPGEQTLSVISLRSMPAPPKGELFGVFR